MLRTFSILLLATCALQAHASVDSAQAARLGQDLTPLGGERAGNAAEGEGSITAFYTVLTEGDDLQDPIADAARAILDGHVVLSRELAEEGIYPAINVESSISRAMQNIVARHGHG